MSGDGGAVPAELPQKLDVTSEHFDAAECLTVTDPSTVSLPFPNIQQLDNFKLCENLVPPSLRAEVKRDFGVPEKTEEQKRKDAEKKAFLCQRAVQYMDAVHEAATRDPIEQIAKRVRKGPLMLLKRAFQAECEIDITTRHARGIRGVLRATLHGFDKYMNMLLADGHEIFVVRQRVIRLKAVDTAQPDSATNTSTEEASKEACRKSCEQGSQAVKTRVGWSQVLRQRKLARIMLRGDQVVAITFAQGELALPPCLAHVQSNPLKQED